MTRPIGQLLRLAQQAAPEDIVTTLTEGARLLHGRDVVLYLVDYEQVLLQPTPDRLDHGETVQPAALDATMAGRCFTAQTILSAERPDGSAQLWVPVTERADRLGVLTVSLPTLDEKAFDLAAELGLLAAQLVLTASAYCDRFHLQRRRKDLNLAAEMQWGLLPPLSFAHGGTCVAGLLEPAYEVGGDCFDYSLNDGRLSLAVFDAMGHGLASSVLSGLAVGAYRHARRAGGSLAALLPWMEEAIEGMLGDAFVTVLAAELDVATGRLSWLSAGHPAPIVVRGGQALPELETSRVLPLGLGVNPGAPLTPSELSLEPGDLVLLYTDGVVESRSPTRGEFGLDRLRDLFARESSSGALPSEMLRRLIHSCLDWQEGRLRDDATLLLLEWNARTPPPGPDSLP